MALGSELVGIDLGKSGCGSRVLAISQLPYAIFS